MADLTEAFLKNPDNADSIKDLKYQETLAAAVSGKKLTEQQLEVRVKEVVSSAVKQTGQNIAETPEDQQRLKNNVQKRVDATREENKSNIDDKYTKKENNFTKEMHQLRNAVIEKYNVMGNRTDKEGTERYIDRQVREATERAIIESGGKNVGQALQREAKILEEQATSIINKRNGITPEKPEMAPAPKEVKPDTKPGNMGFNSDDISSQIRNTALALAKDLLKKGTSQPVDVTTNTIATGPGVSGGRKLS